MKLKTLSLVNYRGFEQLEIKFQDDVNVIAGVNGVGKSSILHVLCIIFGHVLRQMLPSKVRFYLGIEDDDIFEGANFLTYSSIFTYENQSFQIGARKTDFFKRTNFQGDLVWLFKNAERSIEKERRGKNNPQLTWEESEIEDVRTAAEIIEGWNIRVARSGNSVPINSDFITKENRLRIRNEKSPNPLVIYFSTERQNLKVPTKLVTASPLSITGAYSHALVSRAIDMKSFMQWFRVQEELGGQLRAQLVSKLKKAAEEFAGFSDFKIEQEPRLRFMVKKNETWLSTRQLSDGERGLLALIFDLTRRLTIANPFLDDPIADGEAIVLIDELELHLHPSWQRHVLRRLKNTFKNCQFIVTTHSPQIIGQVKPESLILLHREADKIAAKTVTQSFGMSSDWVLQEVMGTPARDLEIERNFNAIYDAIDEDNLKVARERANALEQEVGLFPDLQQVKSMLDRLEMLRDA
jgi:predicted ATP-binding protein involved in virulence